MINQIKRTRQNEAIQAIEAANYNAAILASVGYGKGFVIVSCLQQLIQKHNVKSILYLCDNTRLRDVDFPAEVLKWGGKQLQSKIEYKCYQTCHRWQNKEYDVVVGDEFDSAVTHKYINVFFNNTFKYKILVSGTLSVAKREIAKTIVPIVYEYSTTDGENEGLLNKSIYYTYHYRMNESESAEYTKWTKAYFKAKTAEKNIATLNFLLGKRRQLLYTLDSSYIHTRKVMSWLWHRNKNTRLIIFCERTEQADKVCKNSYHGGNVKKENLNKFQNGEISALAVVSKVKRGINLKNVDSAIFEMLNGGSSTEFEQENGRMKRLPVSQVATIIFMIPWYSKLNEEGETIWKPTIVQDWIYKATCNLKDIEFKNLKV